MNGAGSVESPEMIPLLSDGDDEITPMALTSVAVVDSQADVNEKEEKKTGKKESDYGAVEKPKKKKEKSPQKQVADVLKTDMAAERTFFKWLWTGLHTGAIGSFIFVTFDIDKGDPMRVVVVGFSWFIALLLVIYGTFAYYRRRHALRTGNLDHVPSFTREHSPLVVVSALLLVVGVTMTYAMMQDGKKSQPGVLNTGT
ncbi:hypothetical protein BWQ96_02735 [Gracilariopsis chorda]|uniref:DUF202 domain-containing protein n=1 Tax=Gracilariopsis chorda TaxID=448386 RepID=A0A2V3IZ34_9FLOR|nr:hypothetical protein BWQ96_02735 [Gracilariopsis chorda]|eukprot:PXF47404.1 hypothetical protein BWQ96_02735 [Gracilariopsis chorda]